MLPKRARLKARRLFAKALNPQLGNKLGSSPFFQILGVPHYEDFLAKAKEEGRILTPQFGFIVSKKVDKRAVVRNKLKRQYREMLRRYVLENPPETLTAYQAVVIIVRQASIQASFSDKLTHLQKALSRTRPR